MFKINKPSKKEQSKCKHPKNERIEFRLGEVTLQMCMKCGKQAEKKYWGNVNGKSND